MAPDSGPWEDFAPPQGAGAGPWQDFAPQAPQRDPRAGRGVMGWLQDLPGRLAGGVADAAMSGPKLMGDVMEGRVDPNSKEAIGRSFETAATVSPMTPAAGTARMIAPASRAAKVAAPAQEEVLDAAGEGYQKLRNSNVPLPPEHATELARTAKSKLTDRDFDPEDQPATFKAIERLTKPSDQFGTGAGSAREIYKVRSRLNQIIGDNPGKSEGAAAQAAMEHIDEYLENVPGFAETAKAARANYRSGKMSERITEATEKAQREADRTGSGANSANKLRQAIGKIRDNKKIPKTPEEIEAMDAITKGSTAENIARIVSKLGPQHPLTAVLGATAAGNVGGFTMAGAGALIGHIAQKFAERVPRQKIDELDEMIRMNSPLGKSRQRAGPPPFYRQPYGVPPGTAVGPAAGVLLSPGGGDALSPEVGKQSSILDMLSPVSSAQAAENPIRGGKPPLDEPLADKPTHGGALALPEVGAGRGGPRGKPGDLGDLHAEMNKLISESKSKSPKPKEPEIISPPSPAIKAAITRMKAWLSVKEQNFPNPAMRTNIAIMERGGPIAEAMASGILKTWQPHPDENRQGPVIENEPSP